MLQKVAVFEVINTNVAVVKDSREKIVNLSRDVKYETNATDIQRTNYNNLTSSSMIK